MKYAKEVNIDISPEELPEEPIKEPKIFNIDINKCRKNILYYGVDDYCVFTVFDKVKNIM